MAQVITSFYDQLSAEYELMFENWEQFCKDGGEVLDRVIRGNIKLDKNTISLLDCTCGIGTHVFGLVGRNYSIQASDISEKSIEKAREILNLKGATEKLNFKTCDIGTLEMAYRPNSFNVCLSMDNSFAHVLSINSLDNALSNIHKGNFPIRICSRSGTRTDLF